MPGVGKRHDVINLYQLGGALPALEADLSVGIGIVQRTCQDHAVMSVFFERDIYEVTAQNVVSRIAAVVAKFHGDIVRPCLPELLTFVVSLWRAALNRQSVELF